MVDDFAEHPAELWHGNRFESYPVEELKTLKKGDKVFVKFPDKLSKKTEYSGWAEVKSPLGEHGMWVTADSVEKVEMGENKRVSIVPGGDYYLKPGQILHESKREMSARPID